MRGDLKIWDGIQMVRTPSGATILTREDGSVVTADGLEGWKKWPEAEGWWTGTESDGCAEVKEEFVVVCVDNAGYQNEFDLNGEYLAQELISKIDGETYFSVENKFGRWMNCFTSRFIRKENE